MRVASRYPKLDAHVMHMYHFLEPHTEGEGLRVHGDYAPRFAQRILCRAVCFREHQGVLVVEIKGTIYYPRKRKHWKQMAKILLKLYKKAHKSLVKHGEVRLPLPENMLT